MGPDQVRVTISAIDKYDNFHFTVDFLKVFRFSFPVPVVSPLSLNLNLSSTCRQI